MNREKIIRDDFPEGSTGYDRLSVDAHLAAVAAWTAALEAQIAALEVERDALRRHHQAVAQDDRRPEPARPEPVTDTEPVAQEQSVDEVSARLVATRLVLEGSEPDAIVARLTDAYELEDPEGLVSDVVARLD